MKKYLFALAALSILAFQNKVHALIGEIVDDAVITAENVTDDIVHGGYNHHWNRSYYDSDRDYIVGLESENDRLRAENNRLRKETAKLEYSSPRSAHPRSRLRQS